MLSKIVGIILVLIVSRDIFHELFHPGGSGTLSRWVRRFSWRLFKLYARNSGERLRMAGPVSLALIVFVWAGLATLGWALIILPYLPEAFRYASPLVAEANDDLAAALYISLVSLSTLGFGDITATVFVPRIALVAEAFMGFMLLTAGISWTLSIRPVLTERRSCSVLVRSLMDLEKDGVPIQDRDPAEMRPVLQSIAVQLGRVRTHMMQSPETYYFRSPDERVVLAGALPPLYRRMRAAAGAVDSEVRDSTRLVELALDDLAAAIGEEFKLKGGSTETVLAGYAEDHLARTDDT